MFYVATHDNKYDLVHAADLLSMDLSDKIVVSANYEYYVFYDEQGLVAVNRDVMRKMESKFKSIKLSGILGTNDLSEIKIQKSDSKRITNLGEWALRTRLSYIKHTEKGNIRLFAQS